MALKEDMAQKHFVIIFDDFMPESVKFGSKMMQDLALSLLAEGHKVSVITPVPPRETSSDQRSPYISDYHGVSVYGFPMTPMPPAQGVLDKIKRLRHEMGLPRNALKTHGKAFSEMSVDGIIYYSPSIFFHPLVRALKSMWSCRSYLVLRDIFPQWAIDTGILKDNSPLSLFFKYHERKNYVAADMIGAQTPQNVIDFADKFGPNYPVDVLYNWVTPPLDKPDLGHTEDAPAFSKTSAIRNTLSISEDHTLFFYGGNLGIAQNITAFVKLADTASQGRPLSFIFLGRGDRQEAVKTLCDAAPQCYYLPPVSQAEYLEILSEIDIGLISLDVRNTTHNVPGKTLNYLANDIPVAGIVNPKNDLMTMLDERAGCLIDSFDQDAFTAMINKVLQSQKRFQYNCRGVLEDYFSTNLARQTIMRFFETASPTSSPSKER